MLMCIMDQIVGNDELLDTTRDCFQFLIKFFEPINLSAVHIYHSALELSPLSSIVRKLYYYQRHTTFPRVVAGTPDSWSETVDIATRNRWGSITWSPCGQFIATHVKDAMEIWDALSSNLVSTFTTSPTHHNYGPAYSPDGQSLAYLSDTLMIWDIQTGGAAKEIPYGISLDGSIVWSLDGKMVCMTHYITTSQVYDIHYITTVHVYNIASGTTWSPGTLQSNSRLNIWAHNRSFRIMATEVKDQVLTLNIFEVGLGLTKVESFHIEPWEISSNVYSFSPTTYRISYSTPDQFHILDIQNSECLLEEGGNSYPHCFSSDGNLFAAQLIGNGAQIWRYISGHYTHWRKFSIYHQSLALQFSPTSSSISVQSDVIVQVYHLDSPPVTDHYNTSIPLVVLSPCGSYVVTADNGGSTVTITNLLSQIAPQFIDIDVEIFCMVLTGNVLCVLSSGGLTAWRLTNEGSVDSVFGGQRADQNDSIWMVQTYYSPVFTFQDQTVIVQQGLGRDTVCIYHSVTGEVLKPVQLSQNSETPRYNMHRLSKGHHYPHYHRLDEWVPSEGDWPVSLDTGWVKDPEKKHRLWLPVEWTIPTSDVGGWLSNIKTLWLKPNAGNVIIMLQPDSLLQV